MLHGSQHVALDINWKKNYFTNEVIEWANAFGIEKRTIDLISKGDIAISMHMRHY